MGPGSEHVVFSNRAANRRLVLDAKDKLVLRQAKWIYITSLSGEWKNVLKVVFDEPAAKIAWNPGHIQLKAGLPAIGKYLKQTALLCVNQDEAVELVVSDKRYQDKAPAFFKNARNLLKVLREWVPGIVVVTRGKDGADAYDGSNFFHQDILKKRKRVDTTGVGDAFSSTFTAGLDFFDGDIAKAMYLGVKNTSSVIGEQGAQNGLLSRDDLPLSLRKKIKQ
jgi:sugar/nucleoside kinase (ribokinase family)